MATDEPHSNGVNLTYGNASLSVKGIAAVWMLAVLSILGATMYEGYMTRQTVENLAAIQRQQLTNIFSRIDQEAAERAMEHKRNDKDLRVLACIVAMSPSLRERVAQSPRVEWHFYCPGIMGGP